MTTELINTTINNAVKTLNELYRLEEYYKNLIRRMSDELVERTAKNTEEA